MFAVIQTTTEAHRRGDDKDKDDDDKDEADKEDEDQDDTEETKTAVFDALERLEGVPKRHPPRSQVASFGGNCSAPCRVAPSS